MGDLQSKLGDLAPKAEAPAADKKDEESAEGLSEVDIELIVKQANVSGSVAISTLKKTGDVVKAIMELTK